MRFVIIGGGGQRESNLELYRIITMLAIVSHHFVVNSGILLFERLIVTTSLHAS